MREIAIPEEPGQRRQWVKDRRRQRIEAERERKDRIENRELYEIEDIVDRAWRKLGKTHSKPVFAGFGPGHRGETDGWVKRDGRLVRVDDLNDAR